MPHSERPGPERSDHPLPEHLPADAPLTEVPSIPGGGGVIVERKEDLAGLVEQPALAACLTLHEKGITTFGASACSSDVPHGYAWIQLRFDRLSDENRVILSELSDLADPMVDLLARLRPQLKVPVTARSTVGEIEAAFQELADRFVPQDGPDRPGSLYVPGESDGTGPPEEPA